ncbi:MAG TPA: prolipoprotein diacylglyceryl transferase [Polyangia bacterium]|nr:prolipoprotein diacylglyceryl transferase [Polyangia bacterium]
MLFGLRAFGQQAEVHSYGVAIAAAFIVAIWIGARTAKRLGEDAESVRDLCFWLLVSSMLGARLLFVVTNLPSFAESCRVGLGPEHSLRDALWGCTRALHVWEGGLVFFGGLFGAVLAALWFTRRRGMSFARTADVLAPSVALGHFFGRLGCFAAGCCWGRESSAPWAMRFPPASLVFQQYVTDGRLDSAAGATPPLHPVQLYEALGELLLFFALAWLARRKRYDGQVLVAYLAGYAALRFVVELFRGDAGRKFVAPWLSTSQLIALLSVPLAIGLAVLFRRQQRAFSRV